MPQTWGLAGYDTKTHLPGSVLLLMQKTIRAGRLQAVSPFALAVSRLGSK